MRMKRRMMMTNLRPKNPASWTRISPAPLPDRREQAVQATPPHLPIIQADQ
ncbi:hypothetical protein CHARACLAT_025022, partial [Characodon lateralis]|nr:hypothetical protein [Characodon lateralis]